MVQKFMIFKVVLELLRGRVHFVAVSVATIENFLVINSDGLGIETAADPARERTLLVALVAEEVLAGERDHADVDGVVADWADLGFPLCALGIVLWRRRGTLRVAPSKKTT